MINLNSLASQLLFTTIRIVTEQNDGTQSFGTAFFVHFKVSETIVPVLITNKHVVENSWLGVFFVHLGVKENGQLVPKFASQPIAPPNFQNRWIHHPGNDVDLCAMLFEPLRQEALAQGQEIFYIPITEDFFPTTEILRAC